MVNYLEQWVMFLNRYAKRWAFLRAEVQEAFEHEMACLDRVAQGVRPFEVADWTYSWDRHNGGEVTWH